MAMMLAGFAAWIRLRKRRILNPTFSPKATQARNAKLKRPNPKIEAYSETCDSRTHQFALAVPELFFSKSIRGLGAYKV